MSNDETRNENLPTISEDRIIHGEILRCVDGIGPCVRNRNQPPDTVAAGDWQPPRRAALGTARSRSRTIRKWPGEALPDIDELNAQIPRSE